MRFRVVRAIAEQAVNSQMPDGLRDRGEKVGRILARPVAQSRGGEQMSGMMHHPGQFRKAAVLLRASAADQEVAADVMTFQSGGIDGGFGLLVDPPVSSSDPERRRQASIESPFERMRS